MKRNGAVVSVAVGVFYFDSKVACFDRCDLYCDFLIIVFNLKEVGTMR